jgi:TolB-like protein/DNA-binding winged helix-turn-helix (wHTH) protein/tetratricopeptide (TPR) repeat protein
MASSADRAAGAPRPYRFGPFVLDPSAYELRRDGRRVRLERRPLDLLLLMVERHGQLVTHAEIARRLWGEDVFVEIEAGIHTAVRKVRQALGDSADAPAFLESVPGRGYRFVAALHQAESASVATPTAAPLPAPHSAPPAAVPPPTSRPDAGAAAAPRWRSLTLAALLAVVVAAATSSLGLSDPPSTGLVIGVLPFGNPSGIVALTHVADGLSDELSVSLGQIDPERLRVVGRTTMRRYRDGGQAIDAIGRDVGATHVVEGSVRAEAERVRVTASLVRTVDQTQGWAASFDRPRTSLLGLQDEISRAIAAQVRLRLTTTGNRAASRRHTRNPLAYDAYLQGRAFFMLRARDPNTQAVDLLTQATAIDPEYALAWATLAQVHVASLLNGDGAPSAVAPAALDAAARAVAIRADLAEAAYAQAFCDWLLRWDWPQAEQAMRRAYALDPQYVDTVRTLGHVLSQLGRHDEAAALMQQAREMDPLDPLAHALSGQVAFQAGRYVESLAHGDRALALAPAFWVGHMIRGQALERLDRLDDAITALADAERLSERNSKAVATRAFALTRLGRIDEARTLLDALTAAARQRYVPPYAFALVHLGLGDDEEALAWLTQAAESRDVHLMYVPVDAKWDRLRGQPRLTELLRRSGFRR